MSPDPNRPIAELYENAQELLAHGIYLKVIKKVRITFMAFIVVFIPSSIILGWSLWSTYNSLTDLQKNIADEQEALDESIEKFNADIKAKNMEIEQNIGKSNDTLALLNAQKNSLTEQYKYIISEANNNNSRLQESYYNSNNQINNMKILEQEIIQDTSAKLKDLNELEALLNKKIQEIGSCYIFPLVQDSDYILRDTNFKLRIENVEVEGFIDNLEILDTDHKTKLVDRNEVYTGEIIKYPKIENLKEYQMTVLSLSEHTKQSEDSALFEVCEIPYN